MTVVGPRTQIRNWLRAHSVDGQITGDVEAAVIDLVLEEDDLVGELIADAVKTEANRLRGNKPKEPRPHLNTARKRAATREEVAPPPVPEPLPVPVIDRTAPVKVKALAPSYVAMARMTKRDLIDTASAIEQEIAGELTRRLDDASFLRAVAEHLGQNETVGDRFPRTDDLRRFRSKLTISIDRKVYLGQRQLLQLTSTNER